LASDAIETVIRQIRHWDKQQWQAEQAARDAGARQATRQERKALARRSARNAQRKLVPFAPTLKQQARSSEFEE